MLSPVFDVRLTRTGEPNVSKDQGYDIGWLTFTLYTFPTFFSTL
jgi:hypothetical protein